jgi:hypothetical protein
MTDATALVERYLDTWNENDADARRAAVARLWADGATYTDPLASIAGHDAITELIGVFQEQVPGHVFRLLEGVDSHHNIARFRWELVPAGGGESVAIGSDVAVTDGNGRIDSMLCFLDKVPGA